MKTSKKSAKSAPRNAVAVAMFVQFHGKGGVMRDRRAERGGSKNRQAAYRAGEY